MSVFNEDDPISDETRELPEVQLPVIVYFHSQVEDLDALKARIHEIRHAIQSALADEDNKLRSFTYPEVRLGKPATSDRGGLTLREIEL